MGQCVEEEYFIDVDLSENEKESVVLIFRQRGSAVRMVNSFTGAEARKFFDILNGNIRLDGIGGD